MAGYTGGWGLALIDLDCDTAILVNPDHSQYPASAGKIVIAITALRAVQDGELAFAGEVQEDIEVILSKSLDAHSDRLNDKVTTEQIAAVLERAGTSEASEFEHSWRYAHLTPLDLARAWVSLARGEQLNEELTAYLLDLATRPELGDAFWPFPPDFGVEGYVYGQKAGYWTSEVPVGYRVSAGYARPEDSLQRGLRLRVPDPGGLAGPARLLAAPRLPAGARLHRRGVGGHRTTRESRPYRCTLFPADTSASFCTKRDRIGTVLRCWFATSVTRARSFRAGLDRGQRR